MIGRVVVVGWLGFGVGGTGRWEGKRWLVTGCALLEFEQVGFPELVLLGGWMVERRALLVDLMRYCPDHFHCRCFEGFQAMMIRWDRLSCIERLYL